MQSTPTTTAKRLLSTIEAAEYLGIKPQTLAVWRSTQRYDLPYIRCGAAIKYRLADLERWLIRVKDCWQCHGEVKETRIATNYQLRVR